MCGIRRGKLFAKLKEFEMEMSRVYVFRAREREREGVSERGDSMGKAERKTTRNYRQLWKFFNIFYNLLYHNQTSHLENSNCRTVILMNNVQICVCKYVCVWWCVSEITLKFSKYTIELRVLMRNSIHWKQFVKWTWRLDMRDVLWI